jgi:hypothetical protein
VLFLFQSSTPALDAGMTGGRDHGEHGTGVQRRLRRFPY